MGDQDTAEGSKPRNGPSQSASTNNDAHVQPDERTPSQTAATNAIVTAQTEAPVPTSTGIPTKMAADVPELDDFGLPIRTYIAPSTPTPPPAPEQRRRASGVVARIRSATTSRSRKASTSEAHNATVSTPIEPVPAPVTAQPVPAKVGTDTESGEEDFKDAVSRAASRASVNEDDPKTPVPSKTELKVPEPLITGSEDTKPPTKHGTADKSEELGDKQVEETTEPEQLEDQAIAEAKKDIPKIEHNRNASSSSAANGLGIVGVSEFSHQQLTTHEPEKKDKDEDEWQVMPAYAPYDMYDDDNKLIAKEYDPDAEKETYGYGGLGGAGKGYTRVVLEDDAESVNSIDENTQYLFKEAGSTSLAEDEETQRDAVSQLQATKDLLTEGQRIAYVGLTRLEISAMVKEAEALSDNIKSRRTKKEVQVGAESIKMWSQKMMIRLYTHMDINPAEQVMIEQLSDHGVMPQDLTPVLMANARVKNPMADDGKDESPSGSGVTSPRPESVQSPPSYEDEKPASPPPPYNAQGDEELAADVKLPSQMTTTEKIDIDIRWTVLCDLFLVLIADSVYDSRSRVLLEKVGKDLEISWLDICRFEKKVTDALEMQQNAEKENWNEDQHMENRRKLALKRRYVYMGLATVGGGLVIGLSAGLMAPLIGVGLAAGFTTIGVTGTSGFLAGVGGAALITSGAAASGSVIGVRAANRRTGAVKTFEYRPLHNNKRVNLIVTVSGWMTGKVDDVRLPYSTVDPTMGDIYSVLWEPEMLTSMGDTINILATEVRDGCSIRLKDNNC